MPIFGLVGLALSLLPLTPSFRRYLTERAPEPIPHPVAESSGTVPD